MSPIRLGSACAVLILSGVMLGEQLGAQFGGSELARPADNAIQIAEARIDAVLDKHLTAPLEYVDTPLLDIVAQLQEEYTLPIILDSAALDEVAISADTEVSISLSNITLRSALDLILREPGLEDLTYIIDKEVLLITTKDRANETLQTKVYRVDDFEHFAEVPSESSSKSDCFSPLTSVIVRCVAYDSWKANGTGEGAIQLMQPGMLVVSQTRSVHQEIKALLESLRIVKAEIEKGNSASREYGRF